MNKKFQNKGQTKLKKFHWFSLEIQSSIADYWLDICLGYIK